MSTENDWIFSAAELLASPSLRAGMTHREELLLRRKACDFIEKVSKALDLPKLAQNSACNYLHRFYMRQSFNLYDKYMVAAACILLAAKVEEVPKKIGYIAREYIAVRRQLEKTEVFAFQKHDPQAVASRIASMEGVLLQMLCYDLTISHPYKFINDQVDRVVRLVHMEDAEAKTLSGKIKQVAWSFLNDSAYTCACLRVEPADLATGAVYLAGLYESEIPKDLCTEDGAPWWEVLATPFHILQDAATCLLAAYTDPYIDTQRLPSRLAQLVYQFHPSLPSRSVESPSHPAALLDASTSDCASMRAASPLDGGMCVTSPECGSSQGRSPFDHDFESEVKSPLAVDQRDVVECKTVSVASKKRRTELEEFASRRVKAHW